MFRVVIRSLELTIRERLSTEWWGVRVLQGGILISTLVVFLYSDAFLFPFITLKSWVFFSVIALLVPLWLAVMYKVPERRPQIDVALLCLVAFVLWAAFSTLWADDPQRSWWSTPERMMGVWGLLHAGLLYGMVRAAFIHTKERYVLINWLACVAGGLALLGIWQWYFGGMFVQELHTRVGATLGNPIFFSAYMSFGIFFCLVLLSREHQKRWVTVFFGALLAVQIWAIFLAQTRSTVLALAVGVVMYLGVWLARRIRQVRFSKKKILTLGSFVLLLAILAGARTPIAKRLAQTDVWSGGVYERLVLWDVARTAISERLLLGWGMDPFDRIYDRAYDPSRFVFGQYIHWADQPHNLLLNILLSLGVVGGMLYVGFVLAVMCRGYQIIRKERQEEWILALGLMCALFVYLLSHVTGIEVHGPYELFFICAALFVQPAKRDLISARHFFPPGTWAVSLVAYVLVVAVLVQTVWKPARAQADIITATQRLYAHDIESAMPRYQRAFDGSSIHVRYLRAWAAAEVARGVDTLSYPDPLKQAALEWSMAQFRFNLRQKPGYISDALQFAQIALAAGRTNSALLQEGRTVLEEARALSVRRQSVIYTLVRLALAQERYADAETLLRETYLLFDREPEWWWLRTVVAHKQKKDALAHSLLKNSHGVLNSHLFVPEVAMVIDIHLRANDGFGALAALDVLGDVATNQVAFSIRAVRAYKMIGDLEAMRLAARRAIQLDPTVAVTVEEIMRAP